MKLIFLPFFLSSFSLYIHLAKTRLLLFFTCLTLMIISSKWPCWRCYVWTYDNMILKILVNHANTDTTLEKNFFWWKVLCRSTQFTKSCTCVTESKLSGWKDKIFWFLFGYQLGSCWGIAVIYSLTLHMNNEHPLLVTLSLFEDRKHPEEVG